MRFAFALASVLWLAPAVAGSRVDDLVRIHVEAIGGRDQIQALSALRLSGEVRTGGQRLNFQMLAARPNRLRIETESGGRRRVQGTDGVRPPWERDTGAGTAVSRPMPAGVARTFASDAEFDDPLVAGAERGYALDFAGEVRRDGAAFFRILVTHPGREPISVLLDAVTYLIVERIETRASATGRPIPFVTRYADFRPVGGVLLPHELTTLVEGRVSQETHIRSIEANPPARSEDFGPPDGG